MTTACARPPAHRDVAVVAAALVTVAAGTGTVVTALAGLGHWSLTCATAAGLALLTVHVIGLRARPAGASRPTDRPALQPIAAAATSAGADDTWDDDLTALATAVGLDPDHLMTLIEERRS